MNASLPLLRFHLLTGLLLLVTVDLLAHPELDEQINTLTTQLEQHPANAAELYLQRGDLHRRHEDFAEARADFAKAEELKPAWDAVAIARARTFADEGNNTEALTIAEQLLTREPHHIEALILRAQALVKLGKTEAAITNYTAALAQISKPSPDLFLKRATLQANTGRVSDAVRGLDEGLAKLGPIPSLQLPAIDYERQLGRFDAALGRVNSAMATAPRKETWLALRGEILVQAGRPDEARKSFAEALNAIESLPANRRGTEQTKQLEARIHNFLAELKTQSLTK